MSNMHHMCLPVFCGEQRSDTFLRAFVTLLRELTGEAVSSYLEAGRALLADCIDETFGRSIAR